jgi:hypothetical protein
MLAAPSIPKQQEQFFCCLVSKTRAGIEEWRLTGFAPNGTLNYLFKCPSGRGKCIASTRTNRFFREANLHTVFFIISPKFFVTPKQFLFNPCGYSCQLASRFIFAKKRLSVAKLKARSETLRQKSTFERF